MKDNSRPAVEPSHRIEYDEVPGLGSMLAITAVIVGIAIVAWALRCGAHQ